MNERENRAMASQSISRSNAKNLITQTIQEFQTFVMAPLDRDIDSYVKNADTGALKLHEHCPAYADAVRHIGEVSDSILDLNDSDMSELLSLCRDVSGLYGLSVHGKIPNCDVYGGINEEFTFLFKLPFTCSYRFSASKMLVTLDLGEGGSSASFVSFDGDAGEPQGIEVDNARARARMVRFIGSQAMSILKEGKHNLSSTEHFDDLAASVEGQSIELRDLSNAVAGPALRVLGEYFAFMWQERVKNSRSRRGGESRASEPPPEDAPQEGSRRWGNIVRPFANGDEAGIRARSRHPNSGVELTAEAAVNHDFNFNNARNLASNLRDTDAWRQVFTGASTAFGASYNLSTVSTGVGFSFTGQIEPWARFRQYFDANRLLALSINFRSLLVDPMAVATLGFGKTIGQQSALHSSFSLEHSLQNVLFPRSFESTISVMTNLRNFWHWWDRR